MAELGLQVQIIVLALSLNQGFKTSLTGTYNSPSLEVRIKVSELAVQVLK